MVVVGQSSAQRRLIASGLVEPDSFHIYHDQVLSAMDHLSSAKRKKSQEDLSSASSSKKARKRVRCVHPTVILRMWSLFPDPPLATLVESAIVENKR
jgi:hypothetical protein